MARYIGAVCRLCRRQGVQLFLKGDRCYSDKCAVVRRAYGPGMHGQKRKKDKDYGIHLKEKQKIRHIYGVLEKQFRKTYKQADSMRGQTGENLLFILERRLDNFVYRCGFAASRSEARQIVRHKHVSINGKRADIPSMLISKGDVIAFRESSSKIEKFKSNIESSKRRSIPDWIELDREKMLGRVINLPTRESIGNDLNERLVVEFYSK